MENGVSLVQKSYNGLETTAKKMAMNETPRSRLRLVGGVGGGMGYDEHDEFVSTRYQHQAGNR